MPFLGLTNAIRKDGWSVDDYTFAFTRASTAWLAIYEEFSIPGVFAYLETAKDRHKLPFKPPLLRNWSYMATYLKTLTMKRPFNGESAM